MQRLFTHSLGTYFINATLSAPNSPLPTLPLFPSPLPLPHLPRPTQIPSLVLSKISNYDLMIYYQL